MNPFEPGVASALGLHAVMTQSVARKGERTVQGKLCPFFYNPMWGFFGDPTPGPAGTYYLSSSKPVNYFWNIYDQVLVRPGLIDHLSDVRILDHDATESLLTPTGHPEGSESSDHLPLLFRLQF